MRGSAQEIYQFHRRLAGRISRCRCLGYAVQISSAPDWQKFSAGRKVSSYLHPADNKVYCEWPQGLTGAGCLLPVFREHEIDCTKWTAWSEAWKSAGNQQFDLVGAAWTFYLGRYGEGKTQVFRAEWDNICQRPGTAPQPHWHFDPDFDAIIPTDAEGKPGLRTLVELPACPGPHPQESHQQSPRRLHFGMGGWDHHCEHPNCWQRAICETRDLEIWAEMVLRHAMGELMRT